MNYTNKKSFPSPKRKPLARTHALFFKKGLNELGGDESKALQTPPKFNEKTPRETQKERNCGGRGEKSEILGGPADGGPTEVGPTEGTLTLTPTPTPTTPTQQHQHKNGGWGPNPETVGGGREGWVFRVLGFNSIGLWVFGVWAFWVEKIWPKHRKHKN